MIDERTLELIHEELDGELAADLRMELLQRLEADPAARMLREQLVRMSDALGRMPSVTPPDLHLQLLQATRPRARVISSRERRGQIARYGLALAAGMVFAVVGLSLADRGRSDFDSMQLAGTMGRDASPPVGHVNLAGLAEGSQFDRFIVRFADASAEAADGTARQHVFDAAGRAEGVAIGQLFKMAVGADVFKTNRKLNRTRAEALMRRLANNPNVEYVEVDKLNKLVSTPNDSYYGQQWQYSSATGGIRANEAWNLTMGAGAVVAVLDTGITNHSDLNANVLPGYDFIKDTVYSVDGNGRDSDARDPGDWYQNSQCGSGSPVSGNSSWHGTHVAGTVAAVTNNSKGVAGTAGGAKILPVRVLGRCGGFDSDIGDAMVWASGGSITGVPANPYPAEVINLSLGGGGACSTSYQAAITSAVSRGSTIVVAAGNSGANVSTSSPANCANVIAVGSTTSTGAKSSFSNYGSGVDIAAPGSSIVSTINTGATTPAAEGYATYSGTSMATPHVAGVVALMQAYASTPKTPAQIESLLKSTARAFPVAPPQPIGAGIVNALAAVQAVNGSSTPPPPAGNVAPVANFSFTTNGLTAVFTDSSTDSDGSIASRLWNFGDGTSSTTTSPSHAYASAGTFTVSEKVTDNAGATHTKTASVTVSSTSSGGLVLASGVAVALPSVVLGGVSATYSLVVPAGKSKATFVISGGSGDADLYVRFGAVPTKSAYSCRPYLVGNAETCTFSAPAAGTYYVNVRAYKAFSGVSLKATISP